MAEEFSYYKMHKDSGSSEPYVIKGYGEHPETSVCYGNTRIVFLNSFRTEIEAREAYPTLPHDGTEWGSKFSDRELTRMPANPPEWFDSSDAGERWEEDY